MQRLDLCSRRQWPEPVFTPMIDGRGYTCIARVNNREYQSDPGHGSPSLAQEDAAMQAYWRCQNFSRNDGKHPKESGRGQKVQGRPIAIGTERASTYSDDSRSSGSRSGGSSPTSIGSFSASYYGSSHRTASHKAHSSSGSSSSRSSKTYRSSRYS